MLTPDEMRFAMDDARRRHSAIVDLLGANDRQMLGFLQLYVALTAAAVSGGAAIVFGPASALPKALGIGLLAFAAPLVVGAVFALLAGWPSDVNLPGRDADFWLWANEDNIDFPRAFRAYMETLSEKTRSNSALNLRLARRAYIAKLLGAAAPFVALAAALIARLVG